MNNTFQFHWTSGKHIQNSNPWTFGKHVQIQILGPLGSTSKFKSMDLWETRPKFNLWTSGKHVQTSIHQTSRKHVQISNPWTSGKHVQNFKSIRPLVSMSCTYFYFLFFSKKKKRKGYMNELRLDLILPLRGTQAISFEIRSTF